MSEVDMSAKAVTTRLKRVSQLRRLGLSLQRAKIKPAERSEETNSEIVGVVASNENGNPSKSQLSKAHNQFQGEPVDEQ